MATAITGEQCMERQTHIHTNKQKQQIKIFLKKKRFAVT